MKLNFEKQGMGGASYRKQKLTLKSRCIATLNTQEGTKSTQLHLQV